MAGCNRIGPSDTEFNRYTLRGLMVELSPFRPKCILLDFKLLIIDNPFTNDMVSVFALRHALFLVPRHIGLNMFSSISLNK